MHAYGGADAALAAAGAAVVECAAAAEVAGVLAVACEPCTAVGVKCFASYARAAVNMTSVLL